MKKNCVYSNILDMDIVQINGKKSSQIAKENNVTVWRVNQYAKEHDIPFVSFDGGATVDFYVFDEAAEEKFKNRPRKSTGRPVVPKPPKVPGKPGRPRKEKPIDTSPKNPVGRPRKYPKEVTDIVQKRRCGKKRKK